MLLILGNNTTTATTVVAESQLVTSTQNANPPYLDYVIQKCAEHWRMSFEATMDLYNNGILRISDPDPETNAVTCTMTNGGGETVIFLGDMF